MLQRSLFGHQFVKWSGKVNSIGITRLNAKELSLHYNSFWCNLLERKKDILLTRLFCIVSGLRYSSCGCMLRTFSKSPPPSSHEISPLEEACHGSNLIWCLLPVWERTRGWETINKSNLSLPFPYICMKLWAFSHKDIFLHLSNEKGEKMHFCLVEKTLLSPVALFCEKEEATERMFHVVPTCFLYQQQLTKIKISLTAGKAYS